MKIVAAVTFTLVALSAALVLTRDNQPATPTRETPPPGKQPTSFHESLSDVPELKDREILYATGLPNGRYRAVGIDDGCNIDCLLVDLETKTLKFSFSGPLKGAYVAEISPNETYLAAPRIFQDKISVWSIENENVIAELNVTKGTTPSNIAFSPDELKLAALADNNRVTVWDIGSQKPVLDEPVPAKSEFVRFFANDRLEIRHPGGLKTFSVPVLTE